jgi:hypothetical protein
LGIDAWLCRCAVTMSRTIGRAAERDDRVPNIRDTTVDLLVRGPEVSRHSAV